MDKNIIIQRVFEKLAKKYTPVDFIKFIKEKPLNITNYIKFNLSGDYSFLNKFLEFVRISGNLNDENVKYILKKIKEEGIFSKEFVDQTIQKSL